MNKQEEINALLDCDFTKYQLVVNRIYKDEYVKKLEHNWNELKKWLQSIGLFGVVVKMQELEGVSNE